MEIIILCLLIGTSYGFPTDSGTLSRPVTGTVNDIIHDFVSEFDWNNDNTVHW